MNDLPPLERAVLDWISAHSSDPALAAQIRAAGVRKRDYTRTGIFLYFAPQPHLPAVAPGQRPVVPHIAAPLLPDGAGCSLFLRGGHLHYLEIYARGGFLPEDLQDFHLLQGDNSG